MLNVNIYNSANFIALANFRFLFSCGLHISAICHLRGVKSIQNMKDGNSCSTMFLVKKSLQTRYYLLDQRNVEFPKENNRVSFQEHKIGVCLSCCLKYQIF